MDDNIIWTLEGKIKKEDLDKYVELMNEIVNVTKKEEGTLNYEWTISEDLQNVHVYERYKNADSAIKHLDDSWAFYKDKYSKLVDIQKFTVYSELTDKLKEKVASMNPVYMYPLGGFYRIYKC